MEISILEAGGRLEELIRRAEAGEPVILTREGRPAARIASVRPQPSADDKGKLLADFRSAMATRKDRGGADAARSQDFLYDEQGLPK